MMTSRVVLLLLLCLFCACQSGTDSSNLSSRNKSLRGIVSNAGLQSTKTQVQENGVAIEEPLNTGYYRNPYDNDNQIHRPGGVWRYKVSTAQENQMKVVEIDGAGNWRLSDSENRSSRRWKRVEEVQMEVLDGLGPYDAGFDQTVVKYSYLVDGVKDGDESFTGLIENDANIWIHPLRRDYFEILALNPYPFVKLPLRVGSRFNFDLPINENWSNPEWKKWYGTLKNECRYEIVKQRSLSLDFADLNPYVILSNCENEMGSTGLVAYFEPELGFVKLDYRNIDNSWISFELIENPFARN